MKVLFDHGPPAPLRRALSSHTVFTAHEMGWSELDIGRLLSAAEIEFDVIITTDQNFAISKILPDADCRYWCCRRPDGN